MMSKRDLQLIQMIKEAILPPIEARFDRLEKKVDEHYIEFRELKQQTERFMERTNDFIDYSKEKFELIQYKLESTYKENSYRMNVIETSLNSAGKALSADTTPK